MVKIDFDEQFKRTIAKVKDGLIRERVAKLILKIQENPEIGKPMKHDRKGTREVYLPPFRLSYAYDTEEETIIVLDLYHKDEQ
ncbi:MAG: type II toxin-antitoxin system RelE/ParE family toxin [Nanoarchaeota archaeon]